MRLGGVTVWRRRSEMAVTHGRPGTYAAGCRCELCRVVWREYCRPRARIYRERKRAEELATHPEGCRCTRCRRDREKAGA